MSVAVPQDLVLVGFGATNQAVARALRARGHDVSAVDDQPTTELRAVASDIGIELVTAPSIEELSELIANAGAVVPGPGLPDTHPTFELAAEHKALIFTEFDLAQAWDDRPIAAITGTDGKTTVTTMVTAMLDAAGIRAVDAGNNDLPLVTAIDDPDVDWFVVEASSFRLGRTHAWAPRVATWLNFAPDHLDVHASSKLYEAAKARIWAAQTSRDLAVGNLDDEVVVAHLDEAPGQTLSFSIGRTDADYRVDGGALVGPDGVIIGVDELSRRLPHDLSNALAAAATAAGAGADTQAIGTVLRSLGPLPHRVAPVATIDGVTFYDDSKATVPHATLAAVRGFDSVVLIAGGRNKGVDLASLADGVEHIRAVVAIGDAAGEVATAFDGVRPTYTAASMDEAVRIAAEVAHSGDAVLLSPACASFDWYPNYAARGDDFAARVRALEEAS